ncbi:MAG: hypothetical protein ACRELB_08045 [Polyangiaceae bacterium]
METAAMILGILRRVRVAGTWAPLLAASAFAAACSNNAPAASDAFILATVGEGSASPNSICQLGSTQSWLTVGGLRGGSKPTVVNDGDSQGGAPVHVNCTVSTVGDGFDVSLSVIEEGTTGGSVVITSPSGQGAVTASGGTGISASFVSNKNGAFRETDCTITYKYDGADVPDQPPIAAGRIWAHLSCPSAQESGTTLTGPDGGPTTRQCDGEADFLFEQCGQ